MKNIFLLATVILPFVSAAQNSCFAEGLMMFDQSVATNFAEDYPQCTVIEGDLVIQGNVNFIGMEQIVEIQGNIICGGDGECTGDHENFLGLENVVSIGGVILEENSFSFDGLSSLENVTGDFRLDECFETDFVALSNLVSIGGDFYMSETNFQSFNGLQNLQTVGGQFRVDDNIALLSSEFIESLSSVGGSFKLIDCPLLTNLNDFSGLETINGDLIIQECSLITSLEGLENIESIAGELIITSNALLNDIEWIAGLDAESITHVQLMSNPQLSYCSVTSVCDHLTAGGSSSIQSNLLGCNSAENVIEQCNNDVYVEGVSVEKFNLVSTLVQDQLQVTNPLNNTFHIFNTQGQLMLSSNESGSISVDHLAAGMYFIRVVQSDSEIRFVKQ